MSRARRDLALSTRVEDTREQVIPRSVNFQISDIKQRFDNSIIVIRNQFSIAEKLENNGQTEDAKYIYRSQIVFLESALDFFLHELNKYGLRQVFSGSWSKTEKYNNLKIPMKQVIIGLENPSSLEWFTDYVSYAYSRDVMTDYSYLKDQMNMIGISISDLLRTIFPEMPKPENVIKDLYQRRNQIAHQTDRSHETAVQADITKEYVEERIREIEKIVSALHQEALNKG